jgi:hypothetical protein
MFCTIMWHGPAGRCIFMYVNIQMLYIYMSRHIFEIKCVTCVLFFMMMMISMFPICCDRMLCDVYIYVV